MTQTGFDETTLVDLSHLALIRASGVDATAFLNGQLTNDVTALDARHSHLSAWCSPKGRMLAVFRVFQIDDGYLLQLPGVLRDDILKRLRVYVLRAKVTLEIADRSFAQLGIVGASAADALRAVFGTAPESVDECAVEDAALIARLPGAAPRFHLLIRAAAASSIRERLASFAAAGEPTAWTLQDIMAGTPIVLPQTSDAFVPQMANLDLVGGVSYTKGCYTGQEIVARLHYLGRLKQRMYRARVETSDTPPPGALIYSPQSRGQSTGTVVIAAPMPSSGAQALLAVIHTDSVAAGELHLHRPDGPRLLIEPLPYSF